MDYYVYSDSDKLAIAYNRCFGDAENGRVWLALMRLDDLRKQFPDDPHLDYAEALIRIDYLGEGINAQKLCWKAFQSEPKLIEALFNSIKFAPDRNSFHERINISMRVMPNEQGILGLRGCENENRINGEPYWLYLKSILDPQLFEERPGEYASIVELILNEGKDEIPPIEYAKFVRVRGESLRKLDRKAENRMMFFGERFLPEDRLVLKKALNEFEQYITDPYFRNQETLNLCGVWSMLLGLQKNAIIYADEAIKAGGEDYIYPYRNKALALWEMGQHNESIKLDEETLIKAEQAGDHVQVDEITKVLAIHRKNPPANLTEFRPMLEVVLIN